MPAHVASADYAVRRFAEDPRFISGVVRFDVPLLGDVAGLRGVHLQCHIGTDTVSLARLGASMTGLDFSGPAVEAARELCRRDRDRRRHSWSPTSTPRPRCWTRPSTSSTPGSARCAGCRASAGGRRSSPRCSGRAGGCSSATATRCCGLSRTPRRWPARGQVPVLRAGRAPGLRRRRHLRGPDAVFEHNVSHEWNHGIGEIVTALLDAG